MIFNRSADTASAAPPETDEAPESATAEAAAEAVSQDESPAAEPVSEEPEPQTAANSKPGSSYGGWVRVDSDNVLRGWVTDRNHRDDRPLVEVLIDDEPVALRPADRFDQKLQELGEADGCYSFCVVVPEAYRDGEPHAFEARVQGDVFRLKSKRTDFTIEDGASTPYIEVLSQEPGRVTGRMIGGQFSRSIGLELWSGGRRLDDRVEASWTGSGEQMAFIADYPLDLLEGVEEGAPLVLAAPGMIEAGLPGAPLDIALSASGQINDEGALSVTVEGLGDGEHAVELRVLGADGEVIHTEPLDLADGAGFIRLPPEARQGGATIGLAIDGWAPAALVFQPLELVGLLVANPSFAVWGADGPASWSAPQAGVELIRGYHAFPARIVEQQGISGDFVHLELADVADGEARVLLSQPLARSLPAGQPVVSAMLVRASEKARLRLQLVDADGAEIDGFDIEARRPWVWDFGSASLTAAAGADLVLQVVVIGEAASPLLMVDIAGARIGGDRFAEDAERTPDEAAPSDNAVVNAGLADWPNGVVIRNAVGRSELARGWFAFNRRSQSPVMARALFESDDPDAVAMAVAAPVVPDYCRLEIQLDAAILDTLIDGTVSFEAGAPLAARALLGETAVSTPEFLLIDRVMVLRRKPVVTERGFQLVDETVATVGRRLLVTRTLHRFELPIATTATAAGSDFAWEQGAEAAEPAEYYLVIEFRQPFAIALRNVVLVAGPPARAEEEPYLALEDRSIAAQATQIKGLAAWISPYVATPLTVAQDAEPRPMLRWRWSRAGMGSVEVVVCVYNAVEETLACLRSLMVSTQVPHTVRIIDDGSEPIVGQRLDAFVADKPWMTVVHHENQGYTSSADGGIRSSDADWVVLLNSDTIVTPGWLEGLLEAAASGEDIAMVGPVSNSATFQSIPDLYDGANKFKTNPLPAGWTPDDMADLVAELSDRAFPDAPLLNGFCTLMRRSVFLEVGGLNKAAFPTGYGEENDLCARVTKAGYRMVLADHVYVFHSKSASFGSARRTELAKAGSKALKELHPDVDFNVLTARFREIPSLVRLRAAVRETYEEQI